MKVVIAGAGAIGSTFGGHLAMDGHDVTFVDLNPQHVAAIERDGLRLSHRGACRTATGSAATDFEHVGVADLLMLWCKSFATAEVMTAAAGTVGPGTIVCTLQNGLGNVEAVTAVVPPERIVQGVTTVGARLVGPGHVEITDATWDGTATTWLGAVSAEGRSRADAVAAVLSAAGIPSSHVPDIEVRIWTKLCMASAMSGVAALTRQTIDQVIAVDDSRSLVEDLIREVAAVAHSIGVAVDAERALADGLAVFATATGHLPSMLQDVLADRPTEIDALSGAVARIGARTGVPTPVNATVARLVRSLERSRGSDASDR